MCAMVSGNTCPFCLHSSWVFETLMVCPCSIHDWNAVSLLRGSATCSFHINFGGISHGLNSVTSCRRAICIRLLPVWKQMWFLFGFPVHGTSYTNWEPCQSAGTCPEASSSVISNALNVLQQVLLSLGTGYFHFLSFTKLSGVFS